jgi:1-acyl-sn-glycerol-3-phosphate acyltransferase
MAVKGDAPILPMRIRGAGRALPLKRWWPSLFTRISVEVQPPLQASDLCVAGLSTSEAVSRSAGTLARALGLTPAGAEVPA